MVGTDGKPKSKKEVEGINKVSMMKQISRSLQFYFQILYHNHKRYTIFVLFQVLKEVQSRKETELVQRIIAKVKAECEAAGGDVERKGYSKH